MDTNQVPPSESPPETSPDSVVVTIKNPHKILHFSDGVDEEISEPEEEIPQEATNTDHVDTKTLHWGPWLSHYAVKTGTNVLGAVDYLGEGLASFFGITTPKYLLEIEEFKRVQAEQKKMDDEAASWAPPNSGGDVPLVLQEPGRSVTVKADAV